MLTDGIRILDKKNRIVSVELSDILKEIQHGNQFYWSILYLRTTGHLGEGKSIPEFESQIIRSPIGYHLNWEELNVLSTKFWDLMDILLIASKNKNLLRRYEGDQEMYETCDMVINKFDSNFWEVFSKDETFLNRLKAKFKIVEPLKSDFLSK